MSVVAFTGHRPNKLGGYRTPNPTYNWVTWLIEDALHNLKPEVAISGMALGVDQWAAKICIRLKIPFIAAIPFVGQEKAWPQESQKVYQQLLSKSRKTVVVSEGGYSKEKMQIRNKWMVNESSVLIAVWDGSPGGTGNCVRYAQSVGKEIVRIEP